MINENERSLAHIEKIEWIKPIEGADNIELCGVLGWQCVIAKKENHKVGDLVIYIEVDSVVPDIPMFKFLEDRKFRVRTIKLRNQLSQGLVIPIKNKDSKYLKVGKDVTDEMGIVKYISPAEERENQKLLSKKHWTKNFKVTKWLWKYSWFRKIVLPKRINKNFPSWVSKTDEERIQNIPQVLKDFSDNTVYVTEKIDYQSVTFTTNPKDKKHKLIVCSRNTIIPKDNSLYHRIAEKYNIASILKKYPNLTIQGEQGNTNVQGNKYKITEPRLWVFNIIDHTTHKHFNYTEMKEFADDYGLEVVPLITACALNEIGTTVEEVVEFSKGKSVINPKMKREGIVVRCIQDCRKIMSWKCVNPEFLLKYEN